MILKKNLMIRIVGNSMQWLLLTQTRETTVINTWKEDMTQMYFSRNNIEIVNIDKEGMITNKKVPENPPIGCLWLLEKVKKNLGQTCVNLRNNYSSRTSNEKLWISRKIRNLWKWALTGWTKEQENRFINKG